MSRGFNQPPKYSNQAAAGPSGTSGKATTSLILGFASIVCLCLTGIPGLIFGFIALSDISASQGRLKGKGLAITGIAMSIALPLLVIVGAVIYVVASGAAVVGGALGEAREAARSAATSNNMKQVGIALHLYHDSMNKFPMVANTPEVKAGLSWRVTLLPYIEEVGLSQQFNQAEGWNSPANMAAASYMPPVYGDIGEFGSDRATLNSIVSAQPTGNVKLGIEEGASFRDVPDGSANTIVFVEVESGWTQEIWSAGYDYEVDLSDPTAGLKTRNGRYLVCFLDGSTHRIREDADIEVIKALMTRNGREVIDLSGAE
ncbi:MAG: DUF1559 domain-containing protein [Planctomycetales bacterium]|nr:DUF1559 domain-containing protein [Planctomycetales bacterium]